MRRMVAVLIVTMMLPTISVSANTTPFDFFIDEEVVVHPDETVLLRLWVYLRSRQHLPILVGLRASLKLRMRLVVFSALRPNDQR